MATGTVKFFTTAKGFGFIAPDSGGNDVFVHISDLEKSGLSNLDAGQKVTFDVGRDSKTGKMRATNVREAE